MENRALGKGLSALIPEKTDLEKPENVTHIKTALIKENALQPRTEFDTERLSGLISSIKEKGVLQPILVRKKNENYEVIAGERRLRAARALNMEQVPVVIKSVSDQEALVLALVENIQREELNAIEEAQAFRKLVEDFNFTQDAVAQSVGKDRSTISNILRLLKLPSEIQKYVANGAISMGHARALLSIEDSAQQKKIFERVVRKSLSVRELEHLVNRELARDKTRKPISNRHKDDHMTNLEEGLQRALGTKVRIQPQKKRGKIVIEYYSSEDLERIIALIRK